MSKDESGSGGFLSKMAKFVRHPTVDWSDLGQRAQGLDAEREALKAAIQRKRRNDKVRHNELNHLREVMQARRHSDERATQGPVSSGSPSVAPVSALHPPSANGPDAAKSRTIEQIALIEEQMSKHWLRRRQSGGGEGWRIGGATVPAQFDGGVTQPAHLGARNAPGGTALDVLTHDPNAGGEPDEALAHPGISEAAVRFANGEYDAAEQGLRTLMVQEPQSPTARMAGLALLDLLHARQNFEAFEEFAAEFAVRFGVPVPRWPIDVDVPSGSAEAVSTPSDSLHSSIWICPPFLDAAAAENLSRLMAEPAKAKWLDWTGLLSAEPAAASALLEEASRWHVRPLRLNFKGAAVLRRRLKASTPSGRRENGQVWWLLRLAMLRAMHRREEFDLVALDYCVTYGVMPPEWVEPLCRFEVVDSMPAPPPVIQTAGTVPPVRSQMAGPYVLEWPSLMPTIHGSETQFPAAQTQMSSEWPTTLPAVSGASVRVCGLLTGDMPEAIAAMDLALSTHSPDKIFVIDCQRLTRVDFTAAGTMLQWLMAAMSRGTQVELRGVSRLVTAFFHVVGIDEAVTVRLRQY